MNVARAVFAPAPIVPVTADATDAARGLVLIVEDEVDVRRSAVEAMLAMGYRTIEAENASEALDLLEQNREIDLLLTDVRMPGDMDGAELAFTYVGERFRERVTEMAVKVGANLVYEMDVGSDESINATFAALKEEWDSIDIVIHAIASPPMNAGANIFQPSNNVPNYFPISPGAGIGETVALLARR